MLVGGAARTAPRCGVSSPKQPSLLNNWSLKKIARERSFD